MNKIQSIASLLLPLSALNAYASIDFSDAITTVTGSDAETVHIKDMNNDGLMDVVLNTSGFFDPETDKMLMIFYQNSLGQLNPSVNFITTDENISSPTTMGVGDFNSDGLLDVAVGYKGNHIRIMLQDTSGNFLLGDKILTPNATTIAVGDLDGDGDDDIAGAGWRDDDVAIFYQNAGTMSHSPSMHVARYAGYNDIKIGDVNNDGLNDIVVMSGQSYSYDNFSVLASSESGFLPAAYYDAGGDVNSRGVAIGDLNADGLNDVALTFGGNRPESKVGVFFQDSSGLLGAPMILHSYDIPESVVIHDIDKDGLQDISVVHSGWERLGVYRQSSPGIFDSENLFEIPHSSHANTLALALGDINSDGIVDAAIADTNGLVTLHGISDAMIPPVADAGDDQAVDQGTTVSLDASQSTDDKIITNYSWHQVAGTAVSLQNENTSVANFSAPILAAETSDLLIFELTVADSDGLVSTDATEITVLANSAPIADAGPDQVVRKSRPASSDGTASDSVDDPIVGYQWQQTAGPTVVLDDNGDGLAHFTAPKLYGQKQVVLTFELTVIDALGNSSSDTVMVTVVK